MKFLTSIVLVPMVVATLCAQPVPDFRLPDVNPTSPRFGAAVSPRDYRLQVSGYYFGAAH
jgi:hypothetical protein